jgi:hypothetical protein
MPYAVSRRPARARVPAVLVCLLPVLAVLAVGCGDHYHHRDGFIVVDNRTDLTTNEDLLTFRVAPFGQPFTGDLLGGNLPPLSSRNLGAWPNGYYDAEGDLELGQLIEWFDEYVGGGQATVFEVR